MEYQPDSNVLGICEGSSSENSILSEACTALGTAELEFLALFAAATDEIRNEVLCLLRSAVVQTSIDLEDQRRDLIESGKSLPSP